jgi:acyl-CoA synthetase (AMP-forming)/AMP-acid ligase II
MTASPELAPRTLNDLGSVVDLNAARTPAGAAVKLADGPTRTYAELSERTTRLAHALQGLGLEPGDRIGAWMTDCIEYVELYVASAKAGLVMVPINARLTPAEATFQLGHTGVRALVHTNNRREGVAELPNTDSLILVTVAGPAHDGGFELEALIAAASSDHLPARDPDTPWMICFTSGTTGKPKGAVLTHRSAMTLATTQLVALRIPLYGVNIQAVSMSFPATVVSHMASHLLSGGTQVLAPGKWDTERLLDLIERERATHIYVPGPVLTEFTNACAANPARWRSLVSVLHAGSKADPGVLAAFAEVLGSAYTEGWGMTEISGGVATATTPADLLDPDDSCFTTVGRPVPGTQVVAVDEQRRHLGPGEEGELAVYSPSLMAGYFNDPVATAEVVEAGWYFTGDMGSVDELGRVSISDRRTNMIASGGMNVYPAEIELVIERCPGVVECAVVGAPHPKWGQSPVAVVVADPAAGLTEAAVIEFAQGQLAGYKKPTQVLFVDELPRTTGGKVQRAVLREQVAPALAR